MTQHLQSTAFWKGGPVLTELFSALLLSQIIPTTLILARGTSRAWISHQIPASTDATLAKAAVVDGMASPAEGVLLSLLKAAQAARVKNSSPEPRVGWGSLFNDYSTAACSPDSGNYWIIHTPWPDKFSWNRCPVSYTGSHLLSPLTPITHKE